MMDKKIRILIVTVVGFIFLVGLVLFLGSKQIVEFLENLFAKGDAK